MYEIFPVLKTLEFWIVTDFVTKFASTGNIDMDSRTVLVNPESGA